MARWQRLLVSYAERMMRSSRSDLPNESRRGSEWRHTSGMSASHPSCANMETISSARSRFGTAHAITRRVSAWGGAKSGGDKIVTVDPRRPPKVSNDARTNAPVPSKRVSGAPNLRRSAAGDKGQRCERAHRRDQHLWRAAMPRRSVRPSLPQVLQHRGATETWSHARGTGTTRLRAPHPPTRHAAAPHV